MMLMSCSRPAVAFTVNLRAHAHECECNNACQAPYCELEHARTYGAKANNSIAIKYGHARVHGGAVKAEQIRELARAHGRAVKTELNTRCTHKVEERSHSRYVLQG